jgi:hypothetical protein
MFDPSDYERQRITCRCGKRLFDRLCLNGQGDLSDDVIQIDCDQCQYWLYRTMKFDGEQVDRRTFVVIHSVDLATGEVVTSEVFRARRLEVGRTLELDKSIGLERALTRPWVLGG